MLAADAAALQAKTPLWLYILAEGQASLAKSDGTFPMKTEGGEQKLDKDSNAGTQLGPVGGRILMEVFFALLDEDQDSYFKAKNWSPVVKPGAPNLALWDVLHYIGLT